MKLESLRLMAVAALCFAMSSNTVADAKTYSLQVALKNGQTVKYELSGISQMDFSNCGGTIMKINADGTDTSVASPEKATFDGGNMVVTAADGDHTYGIATLGQIAFDLTHSGIGSISADGLTVTVGAENLVAVSADGGAVVVEIYNMQGSLVASASAIGDVAVDLLPLASGAYIAKVNNTTIKFIR